MNINLKTKITMENTTEVKENSDNQEMVTETQPEPATETQQAPPTEELVMSIAKVCHQANKAWCEANGDNSQKDWEEAEGWQKQSAIDGVLYRFKNPNGAADAQHNAWMNDKIKYGWVYGEVKDEEAKTHPCIVPFEKLPVFQQKKDRLFCEIVDALK
jgi:hypothetical protein